MAELIDTIVGEFGVSVWQVKNVVAALDDGCSVPFIARYRKESHGSLDDQILRRLAARLSALRTLYERRDAILKEISSQANGALTDELESAIRAASTLRELEDLYRPYKPKRRTRATVARERGLKPLADILLAQSMDSPEPYELAATFVNPDKDVADPDAALAGARDIIAETAGDNAELRRGLRAIIGKYGRLTSCASKDRDSVYRSYYAYDEPLSNLAPHRILAINRGEAEGVLRVKVISHEAESIALCNSIYVKPGAPSAEQVQEAVTDAYHRLISPSMENETRAGLTEAAQAASIDLFSQNLKNLLMQKPIKNKVVLALDPGLRTGCKAAVVDSLSRVVETGVLYPLPQHGRLSESKKIMLDWIKKHRVDAVAIGNGTGCRETEQFVSDSLSGLPDAPGFTIVDEAGASVYSASELAANELPKLDVTLRGAVSLARRLQDPLSELVKIDPKSIGVGQYQHDMDQKRLAEQLDCVVEDCVNAVGVDLNTASPALLARVSGIGPVLAKNIVSFRHGAGAFKNRERLMKVKRMGPKAYMLCAGFLRIRDGDEPLDASAVHPESYDAARGALSKLGYSGGFGAEGLADIDSRANAYPFSKLCAELGVGEPTLRDIVAELKKPGRDPRDDLPPVSFRHDVLSANDLAEGMSLIGTVRNVTDFGAFIDIGVHRDGLAHISRLSSRRINHPSQVVKVGEQVKVWVVGVDKERNQISLSLVKPR